jgi:hypothetical protein
MNTLTIKLEKHEIENQETQWVSRLEGDDTYKALVVSGPSITACLVEMAVSIEILHEHLNNKK